LVEEGSRFKARLILMKAKEFEAGLNVEIAERSACLVREP
jgi:hypothetical protein